MERSTKSSVDLERRVEPKGHLLSDNDTGVDHLGYSVYAEALAKMLVWVQTPITVGVFAPWGSGKSFLLREVRYLLQKHQHQRETEREKKSSKNSFSWRRRQQKSSARQPQTTESERQKQICSCAAWTFFLLAIIFIFISTLLIALHPSVEQTIYETVGGSNKSLSGKIPEPRGIVPPTDTPTPSSVTTSIGFFAVVSLLSVIGIVFLTFTCCVTTTDSRCWNKTTRNMRLVTYSAFTTLPTLGEKRRTAQADYDMVIDFDEDAELFLMDSTDRHSVLGDHPRLKTKYIFVNFNAWEYAGSDTLWAGIVTNLTQAIEREFGVVTSRLFRLLDVEEVFDDSKCQEPSMIHVQIRRQAINEAGVKRLMKQYGVVIDATRVNKWWEVQYSNSTEARNALKSLKIAGFTAALGPAEPDLNSEHRDEKSELPGRSLAIEMDNLCTSSEEISISSRDVRSSGPDPQPTSFCNHFLKYPKRVCCGCPFLYFCILLFIAVIIFPIGVCVLVSDLRLNVFQSTRPIPIEVQILAWMPATAASLLVIVRFCYAMFRSQTRRVNQALVGAKGNMAAELGFMRKVKDEGETADVLDALQSSESVFEIKIIEKLVRCLRFTHQVNYKIVISIDDLDRCSHEKVKSVLEAVSILLSDRCSPFVCLIALDSRVAVKCIEEGMGEALLKANVNGHEYLKKIINLPFCLPELCLRDKRRYFAGMMDQADRTKLLRKSPPRKMKTTSSSSTPSRNAGSIINWELPRTERNKRESESKSDVVTEEQKRNGRSDAVDGNDDDNNNNEVSEREFLFLCRKFLHDDDTVKYHLSGNARNMKRIFNVVSMTTQVMRSLEARAKRAVLMTSLATNTQTQTTVVDYDALWTLSFPRNCHGAKDLVRWVILTDQWPYRMSYILQVIEDADQRSNAGRRSESIADDAPLADIYEKVVIPELNSSVNVGEATLLSLDGDPDLFLGFLQHCCINKARGVELKNVTMNLDQSLRQNIALYRSLVDLKCTKQLVPQKELQTGV